MAKTPEQQRQTSALNDQNAAYIEQLYARWQRQADSVDPHWRIWFEQLQNTDSDIPPPPNGSLQGEAHRAAPLTAAESQQACTTAAQKQAAVLRLINVYRVRGHQAANINPLADAGQRKTVPDLCASYHGLGQDDLDRTFHTGSLAAASEMPLRQIIALLDRIYLGPIGAEYMHITDTAEKRWLQQALEAHYPSWSPSPAQQHAILDQLIAAEGLERFLHTRYVGQKRFSLEGGDALIPCLHQLIERAAEQHIDEAVLAMAHRGRLNVLVNILGKPPKMLFDEFEGQYRPQHQSGTGDVKYHMGFSSEIQTASKRPIHVALAFNPSHLEIVNPVVCGSVRARQKRRQDSVGKSTLPILIHGDAAFAGQGVIMETLNMSQAQGFAVGGSVHIIINNQIGFTTSDPLDARSTLYCSEVAKMVQAPILHINGDHPEAIVFAASLALDYRQRFHKDIVLDIVCYRRNGHNEADEPHATQPCMYKQIDQHPTPAEIYRDHLIQTQQISEADYPAKKRRYIEQLQAERDKPAHDKGKPLLNEWHQYTDPEHWSCPCDTRVPASQLRALAEEQLQLPDDITPHPRVKKILDARAAMAQGQQPCDWGFAETLAYASLLDQGYAVRLSGQDSERGTFFHRHSVIHDQDSGKTHTPLKQLAKARAERAQQGLTIWEAQFGDFANGAQVLIDQFISSAEAKWGRYCGLVLYLPHGQEGQGPEHSSARPERYLQLCAQHNLQITQPSNAAQIFHLLRRQMLRRYRRPLIVFSPKSLLRNPLASSPLEALSDGQFHPVLDDPDATNCDNIQQLILCTGKVYYELKAENDQRPQNDTALIRIEQLYPFPHQQLADILKRYPQARHYTWCQEEPKNQGYWYQIQHKLRAALENQPPKGQTHPTQAPKPAALRYAGRPAMAAPAPGYKALYEQQRQNLLNQALNPHA